MSSTRIQDAYPLSLMQQGMLFHSLYEPASGVYVNQLSCALHGALDIPAFIQAWQQVIDRHTVLRTAFAWETLDKPLQIVGRQVQLPWTVQDWRTIPSSQQQERLHQWLQDDRTQGFDLSKAPLMRLTLMQLDEATYHFVWSHHHLLLDGWSVSILFQEILASYQAICQKQSLSLPVPHPYRDYIAWLQQHDQSQAETFWRSRLQGFSAPTPIGSDLPRPAGANSTSTFDEQAIIVSSTVTTALQLLAQQQHLTLNTIIQGTWALLLRYYSNQDDVVFGATVAGRPSELTEVESRVGLFINTLPIRVQMRSDFWLLPWLQQLQQQQVEARQYEYSPLVEIQGWSDVPRSLALFESLIVFENYPLDTSLREQVSGLEIRNVRAIEKTHYPLTVVVIPGTELVLRCLFDTHRFTVATIQRMVGHWQTLLAGIATNPNQLIADLPLMTDTELHQLLIEWNQTEVEYPQQCLHQWFEDQVKWTPEAISVTYANQQLTYGELNCKANQLAHHLQTLGVQPDTLVGICVERSPEMIIGLLGILKAGGAYVPLDPSYPSQRLAFMLNDAQVPILLTQQSLLQNLPRHDIPTLCLDANWDVIVPHPDTNPISHTQPEHLAYVIYTSGSTGQPKGVMNTHQGICSHLHWMQDTFDLTTDDRVLHKTPFSFDVSIWELFWPLLTGARLVMAQPGGHQDSTYLAQTIARERITTVHFVPSMLQAFLDVSGLEDCTDLKRVLCSGEALSPSLQARYSTRLEAPLYNLYGPTEAAIDVTCWPCSDVSDATTVPIGRPVANTQLYVLNASGKPVPVGVAGELHLGGVQLARGYLNRPEQTAAAFIPHPFSDQPGARLYKTGDLVRYRADGVLEYLGRSDHQVKVRGCRIELGEIEAALRQQPGVLDAIAVAREDRAGDQRLVAYLVPQAKSQPNLAIAELRHRLHQHLPDYMVPQGFVILDTLPLTPNGKVDRRSLPAPELDSLTVDSACIAPTTPIEEILAGIWADVLGLQRVGCQDNFFELGGHSLLATRVVSKLRQVFQIELPLHRLFEAPTIAALAKEVAIATQAAPCLATNPIEPIARTEALPLSFAQQRLWFLAQLELDSAFYNIPAAIRLQGQLNPQALERSIHEILHRHEVLRTQFKMIAGRPVVEIAPFVSDPLLVIDLQALPTSLQDQRLNELVRSEMQQAFDLQTDVLLRVKLLQINTQEHVLLLTMHHIASDGWSIDVLVRELCTLYPAFCSDLPSPMPALPIQYVDFAAWQRQWLTGDVLASQLSYWQQQLNGAPPLLNLPTDYPRPTIQTFRGATYTFKLAAERLKSLKMLSQRNGSTLFMTLLAAFNVLLYRYSDMEDIVIGSAIANRNRAELENLIGFFVNTLALRTDLSGNPTFRELLRRVREVTLAAYAHQDLPFERVVEALQPPRDPSYNPIVQVMLVLQNAPKSAIELPNLTLTPLPIPNDAAKLDLTLYLNELEGELLGTLEYNTDLFAATTMQRLTEQFQFLLDGIIADPNQHLSELPLLTPSERQRLLVDWNQTQADYPQACIHHCFEFQAERTPDAIAFVLADQSLTYRELNVRANQLAHHLQALGVQPETLVGICLERSLELMVGLLAILKAGGAYVPLDPAYPPERLSFILQDAQVPFVLTQQAFTERLSPHAARIICIDTEWAAIARPNLNNPTPSLTPDSLAYVIYTSGSTGAPKGVLGSHQGAVNRFHWMWTTYPFVSGEVCCQKTALNFVDSVWEIFGPLLHGIQTVIIPDRVLKDPHALIATLAQHQVTRLVLVPSLLRVLLELYHDLQQRLPTLKFWVTSGEVLPFDLLHLFRERLPDSTVLNLYGSSEVAADVTSYPIRPSDAVTQPVLIGRAIANTQLYVLDQCLHPVPIGVPGELYVAGAGVARGYLNRPDLTAARFIPNPFSPDPASRLYQTGDRVRYDDDGNLEYLGRLDQQVKLRGFRIEPAEIEWILSQSPVVQQAVVVAQGNQTGNAQLVAYVVTHPHQTISVPALRLLLKQKLPDYMVPSAFVVLDTLPLLPNGKLDRQALPQPESTRLEGNSPDQAPYTELERAIATLWQTCLNLQTISIHDNFFDLGGHSLLLVQVHSQLQHQLQREFPLVEMFQYPTIQALAQHLSPQSRQPPTAAPEQRRSESRSTASKRRKQVLDTYRAIANNP
jgi:amino acid adenylation domain-containing protein